jgi:5-methylcytosine-specific restriction endonuclease McrA
MARRPCLDCGTLTPNTRCPTHTRTRDQARGSRQARGYDRAYEQARDAAIRNATHCATCGDLFTTENPATGGHVRAIRNGGSTSDGIKPECRRCNYGWSRSGS